MPKTCRVRISRSLTSWSIHLTGTRTSTCGTRLPGEFPAEPNGTDHPGGVDQPAGRKKRCPGDRTHPGYHDRQENPQRSKRRRPAQPETILNKPIFRLRTDHTGMVTGDPITKIKKMKNRKFLFPLFAALFIGGITRAQEYKVQADNT